jgi:ATP-dependent exoDNAse (exonuclease V) beta subunit
LAGLKKTNQLNTVLEKARNEAWFSEVEVLALGKALEDLFKRPDMEPYFHQDSTVYNERSILVPGQQNRIPDRLCCYREKWYIADYKTGIALKKHETQTTEYAYLLKEAGFPVAQAALIYLGEEPTVQLINF